MTTGARSWCYPTWSLTACESLAACSITLTIQSHGQLGWGGGAERGRGGGCIYRILLDTSLIGP